MNVKQIKEIFYLTNVQTCKTKSPLNEQQFLIHTFDIKPLIYCNYITFQINMACVWVPNV